MKLGANQKFLLIGDSITDCGRKQPVGEGRDDALGKGYVAQVNAMLLAAHPELAVRVVNMGTSGNTVRSLRDRWQRDVLELRPDWLSVMIGINDVWRQFDQPFQHEIHVHIEEYETTLRQLIGEVRPSLQGLVLLPPYYLEPNRSDPMRAMMDRYGQVVRRIAAEQGAIFVDVQAAFDRALEHVYPAALAWDRVHPNAAGHMVITHALLEALGFSWPAGA